MNIMITLIASGWIFWAGAILLLLGTASSLFKQKAVNTYISRFLCVLGLIGIIISSTPLSTVWYIFLIPLSLAHLALPDAKKQKKIRYGLNAALIICVITGCLLEFKFWLDSSSLKLPERTWVIADSISAGTGFKGERVWTELLAEKYQTSFMNKSVGGGTAASSVNSLSKIDFSGDDLFIIEIGGNDILSKTPTDVFQKELDRLLSTISEKGCRIIMFELPLPPFCNSYGKIQREAAKKFKVTLIPKRHFAWILSGSESTVDGLHLSNTGQEKMSQIVSRYIKK